MTNYPERQSVGNLKSPLQGFNTCANIFTKGKALRKWKSPLWGLILTYERLSINKNLQALKGRQQ